MRPPVDPCSVLIVPQVHLQHPSFMDEYEVDRWGDLRDKTLNVHWMYAGKMHEKYVFIQDPARQA